MFGQNTVSALYATKYGRINTVQTVVIGICVSDWRKEYAASHPSPATHTNLSHAHFLP